MKRLLILMIVLLGSAFPLVTFGQPILDATPRDGVYDRETISEVPPIPYSYLREADVVWSKRIWRTIDMREKMNQTFYFPETPQSKWKSFAQILWDAVVIDGTITAYNADIDDQFTSPMTPKEVKDRVEKVDSTQEPSLENEDSLVWMKKSVSFESADVKKIYIKEDYYFDRQRSLFEVRILGISISIPKIVKGMPMGEQQLFWVYFPECRPVFAKNEMFNLKNGVAGRMTYDDVFMKRMFASYITKEENVYNRSIGMYAKNVDALLEAEKAKSALFEFESNLWEY